MKIKTFEITGTALDWAAAKCEGHILDCDEGVEMSGLAMSQCHWAPSTKWAQGGPIIERERIRILPFPPGRNAEGWWAGTDYTNDGSVGLGGPTPLIAAMRCYIASKLGDEVDVPAELL